MNPLGLAEVLLDREEERLVRSELGQLALRGLVEIVVRGDLRKEVRQAAGLLQRGHPEEDPAGVVVLRDGLEGFDVVEPQPMHRLFNDRTYSADTARPGDAGRGGGAGYAGRVFPPGGPHAAPPNGGRGSPPQPGRILKPG